MRTPAWASPYIGLPFHYGSDGPTEFDCWGLVRLIYQDRYGITLPALKTMRGKDRSDQLEEAAGDDWVAAESSALVEGDVLVFIGSADSVHVGMVVSPGWMIHTKVNANSCLERYERDPWRGSLIGVYRHKGIDHGPRDHPPN